MSRHSRRTRRESSVRAGDHYTHGLNDYWLLSARPLHALALLTPLVLLYELGSLLYLTDLRHGEMRTIKAKNLLADFMQVFGVAGLLAPGVAMLVVLLFWHMLSRDRWQVRPLILLGMVLEAALWTLPLVVFGALLKQAAASAGLWAAAGADDLSNLSWQARATISLGAGLYEELVFRLVAIALLHFAARDVLQLSEKVSRIVAIGGSAVAFALYHRVTLAGGDLNWPALVFYTAAGVYFATLYLYRGFGVVVATHALYDLMVLVLLRPGQAG